MPCYKIYLEWTNAWIHSLSACLKFIDKVWPLSYLSIPWKKRAFKADLVWLAESLCLFELNQELKAHKVSNQEGSNDTTEYSLYSS